MSTRTLTDGWSVLQFREIAENITERVEDPASSGLDYYVGLEHLDPDTVKISRTGAPSDVEATKLRFYPGDVIYARRRAYQRKLGVAEWDGVCSAHALVLRARHNVCDPSFLPYFLLSDQFHRRALDISVGSLSPTINWKTLAVQEFALPPLPAQKAIASALSEVSDLIARYEAVEAAVAEHRDAVAADAWRSSASSCALAELADITVGIVVKPAALYVEDGGVPALRSLNVIPNQLDETELVRISRAGHHMHRKSQLAPGDVVVVRTGRPGDAAVIPADGVERNAIDLLIVRCSEGLHPQFLSCYLNSAVGRSQTLGRSAGTAQQHLNAGQLQRVQIPTISMQEQLRIVRLVEESDRLRRSAVDAARAAVSTRTMLREHLLHGVVD